MPQLQITTTNSKTADYYYWPKKFSKYMHPLNFNAMYEVKTVTVATFHCTGYDMNFHEVNTRKGTKHLFQQLLFQWRAATVYKKRIHSTTKI
jgi:hypothetical protein